MCLTIPKKVIEIKKDGIVVVENLDGNRQELKSLVELNIGDFVISQHNMIIEALEKGQAEEIIKILQNKERA